eukprot:SAG11_NODE_32609_length_282_cov_0.846995_1_plen_32_part_10
MQGNLDLAVRRRQPRGGGALAAAPRLRIWGCG